MDKEVKNTAKWLWIAVVISLTIVAVTTSVCHYRPFIVDALLVDLPIVVMIACLIYLAFIYTLDE